MRNKLVLLLPLVLLSACSPTRGIGIIGNDDYVSELTFEEGFKIMQLADLHWSQGTDFRMQEAYITSMVESESPDLIVLSGDNVLPSDKYVAERLYSFLSSLDVPYCTVYGNHDYQGTYPMSWMDNLVTTSRNSLTKIVEDDVWGKTNYAVELKSGDDVVWRINLLDSGMLDVVDGSYTYDYIRNDQVRLYEQLQEDNANNILFFHVPVWEFALAYDENPDPIVGEIDEPFSWSARTDEFPGKETNYPFFPSKSHDSGIFDSAKTRGCKGIFTGHDHANDWVGMYQGVAIGYGVKTGRELYYGTSEEGHDLIGCSTVELHADGSFDLTHIYVEERDCVEYRRELAHVE